MGGFLWLVLSVVSVAAFTLLGPVWRERALAPDFRMAEPTIYRWGTLVVTGLFMGLFLHSLSRKARAIWAVVLLALFGLWAYLGYQNVNLPITWMVKGEELIAPFVTLTGMLLGSLFFKDGRENF